MENDATPLCCCEYFDNNNEINHILTCCCSCEDLDEGFESLVTGHGFPGKNRSGLARTIRDRMRIPWNGGAKQVSFDCVLAAVMLTTMVLLSAINLYMTVFSFTAVLVILLSTFRFFIRTIPRTKFFITWTITSIVVLYVIFELIVIPMLEIHLEENIVLSVIFALFLLSFHMTKVRNNRLGRTGENEAESGAVGTQSRCLICQVVVPEKDHHCVWFDACVGRHNQFFFILTLLFALITLLYSANLTLTSVCHPYVFWRSILMPDDCSEVYEQYDLGLSFVAAVYSVILAALILLLFLQQVLLVSIGLTTKEWRRLSCLRKCFLGLCATRPNSCGFFGNWRRIIFYNEYRVR